MSWRVKVVAGLGGVASAKGIFIRHGFSREPRRGGRGRKQGNRDWPKGATISMYSRLSQRGSTVTKTGRTELISITLPEELIRTTLTGFDRLTAILVSIPTARRSPIVTRCMWRSTVASSLQMNVRCPLEADGPIAGAGSSIISSRCGITRPPPWAVGRETLSRVLKRAV